MQALRKAVDGRARLGVALAVCATVLVPAEPAEARRTVVKSAAEFREAVRSLRASGGIIVLARGRYDRLAIGRHPARTRVLTVRARPGASVRILRLTNAHNVRIVNLRVTPRARKDSRLDIVGSRRVVVRNAVLAGTDVRYARIRINNSRGVVIRQSRLTRCGRMLACIRLFGDNENVTVTESDFHDCIGCDFIRGRFAARMTIRGNTFHRALAGSCLTALGCNHQDHVQVDGGQDLLVEGNEFGVYEFGAGQLFVRSGVGVTIRNNVFQYADPGETGVTSLNAIVLGTHLGWAPLHVRIEGNEIFAGNARPVTWGGGGAATSILLWPSFEEVPVEERPVLVGNVIGLVESPEWLCPRLRESSGNHVLRGVGCSDADTTETG